MFTTDEIPDIVLRILFLGPLSLVWIALVVRMIGLRSFSKMTAFDFISTVATGSLLAGAAAATGWGAFFQSSGAVLAILSTQALIAMGRTRSSFISWIFENKPILLMEDGMMIESNMRKTRVTEDDIRAKLREANVLEFSKVRAVILETTGDISVMHGENLDEGLLKSIRRS